MSQTVRDVSFILFFVSTTISTHQFENVRHFLPFKNGGHFIKKFIFKFWRVLNRFKKVIPICARNVKVNQRFFSWLELYLHKMSVKLWGDKITDIFLLKIKNQLSDNHTSLLYVTDSKGRFLYTFFCLNYDIDTSVWKCPSFSSFQKWRTFFKKIYIQILTSLESIQEGNTNLHKDCKSKSTFFLVIRIGFAQNVRHIVGWQNHGHFSFEDKKSIVWQSYFTLVCHRQ